MMKQWWFAAMLTLSGDASETDVPPNDVVGHSHGFVALLASDCLVGDQNGNYMDIVGSKMSLGGSSVITDSSHRIPLRYDFRGPISLDQCGTIANKSDLEVLGFVWGATNHTFNTSIANTDVHNNPLQHTLQYYSSAFDTVPQNKFGCSIVVGDNTSLDTPFSCGDAADLCAQLAFHPSLVIPDVAGKHANAVCCQQLLNDYSGDFTVNEYWLAYTRTSTYNSSCEPQPDAFAATKPEEKWAVYWSEWVFYFVLSCRQKPVMSLHPMAMLYWYMTLWANCAGALMTSSHLGLMGVQSAPMMFILHTLMTQVQTFVIWTLPMMAFSKAPNPFLFSFGMCFVGTTWTQYVIDSAYDPLYVTLLGHHIIVVGIFSFFVTLGKMPFQTAGKWALVGREDMSKLYKISTGQKPDAPGEYYPWFLELNRPIPDSMIPEVTEGRAPGSSGSVLPLLNTAANDDHLQDDPLLNTTGSANDLQGNTKTKAKQVCDLLL